MKSRIVLGFIWAFALVQLVSADVVDETPDYSIFRDKLRPVPKPSQPEEPASPPEQPVDPMEQAEKLMEQLEDDSNPQEVEEEIVQPEEEETQPERDVFDPIGKVAQLNMLIMLKIRIEKPSVSQYERKLPVDYRLAKKFVEYWNNLNGAQLNPDDKFEKSAIDFINEPKNIELANKLKASIEDYRNLVALLLELEIELEESGDDRQPPEQTRVLVRNIDDMFAKIGDSFDVRALREKYKSCTTKYQQFFTMDKFINSESW